VRSSAGALNGSVVATSSGVRRAANDTSDSGASPGRTLIAVFSGTADWRVALCSRPDDAASDVVDGAGCALPRAGAAL